MIKAPSLGRFGAGHAVVWLVVWATVLLIFRDTSAVVLDLWRKSDTYAHAFLVFPIVAWLLWRVRAEMAAAVVRPMPWLLGPLLAAMGAWLLSEVANVGVVGHFALATMLVLAVPAVFGLAVARTVIYPLAFVYFAVPFGDALMPLLMEWTADVTVWALTVTGIPVYREGLYFMIPSGNWSVVEACSGLRYLIASLMVGSLFAYLNYSGLRKRLLFVAASIVVPVLANWARAYMIVMIGHLSSNRLAAGVDHLIYGWVFFGLVIGIMFFIGARFADPLPPKPASMNGPSRSFAVAPAVVAAAGGVLALAIAARWVDIRMDAALAAAPPAVQAPVAQSGWERQQEMQLPWVTGFQNPANVLDAGYRQGDVTVHLWIGYYRQQRVDSKLVTSTNGVLRSSEVERDWAISTSGSLQPTVDLLPAVRTADVRGAASLGRADGSRFRTWRLYWVDGRWVSGDVQAKLWQAMARLQGRGDDGAIVLLATPQSASADESLEKFARAHLAGVGQALAAARDTR